MSLLLGPGSPIFLEGTIDRNGARKERIWSQFRDPKKINSLAYFVYSNLRRLSPERPEGKHKEGASLVHAKQ
jgi:hypothetical protein